MLDRMRMGFGRAATAIAAALLLASCFTSHSAPTDASVRRDSRVVLDGTVIRDGAPFDAEEPPPPMDGGGEMCGDELCVSGQICCSACGGPPFFCAPASAGCPDVTCPPPPPGGTGYVVDSFQVGAPDPTGDPNVVPGMNLDGMVSDGSDPGGCFHLDFTSLPPDNEPGVDNQMGPILSAIGGGFGEDYASAIASGQWLILLSIEDGSRTIQLYRGTTADGGPPRSSGGSLSPGQAFRIIEPLGTLSGRPIGTRLRAEGSGIVFPFSWRSMGSIRFITPRLYGNFAPGRISAGVLGGAYYVDQAVDEVVAVDPTSIPRALARSVLDSQADLLPDDTGMCTAVSTGYTFTAVSATIVP